MMVQWPQRLCLSQPVLQQMSLSMNLLLLAEAAMAGGLAGEREHAQLLT